MPILTEKVGNKILKIVDELEHLAGLLASSPRTEADFIIRRELMAIYYRYRGYLKEELNKIDNSESNSTQHSK